LIRFAHGASKRKGHRPPGGTGAPVG
jgi:hypothetical protein